MKLSIRCPLLLLCYSKLVVSRLKAGASISRCALNEGRVTNSSIRVCYKFPMLGMCNNMKRASVAGKSLREKASQEITENTRLAEHWELIQSIRFQTSD